MTTAPHPTITELLDLGGSSAIVTGGSMGIGRGIVERLHEAGAAILIADIDLDAATGLSEQLNEVRAGSAGATAADVGRRADVEEMVTAAVDAFGGLDILVNNAGIYPFSPFLDMDGELFERVMRVNLFSVFWAMQAAARQMISQGRGGRIINVSSIDALHPSMVGLATTTPPSTACGASPRT